MVEFLGNGLSGMYIILAGKGLDNRPLRLCWEIIARNNDGPKIPCLAAVAITRKLAAGRLNLTGAVTSLGLLTLEEYLAELEGMAIETRLRELPAE